MGERRRVLHLILVMAGVVAVVLATAMALLYRAAFTTQEERLLDIARSQARLMEAVARFDAAESRDYPGGPAEATLHQIREAHGRQRWQSRTGEFTLSRRKGDRIEFLIWQRDDGQETAFSIPFDSLLAEPARRALLGQSGTVVGLDYDDSLVLAAYEPVAALGWGVVAKVDLAEIRAPFIRAGAIVGAIALALACLGALLFVRMTNPLLRQLEESEEQYRELVENMTSGVAIYEARDNGAEFVLRGLNRAGEQISGVDRRVVLGKSLSEVFPSARQIGLQDALARVRETGRPERLPVSHSQDQRISHWVENRIYRLPTGLLVAIYDDVTPRQQAEAEVRQLTANLERRVAERTAELAAANAELEAFAYSVSHDLRGPLRSLDGFSQALLEDYGGRLDATGQDFLRRVRGASQRMGLLIDDLLQLSRVTRSEMHRAVVDLSALAAAVAGELTAAQPERRVAFAIAPGLRAHGDERLLRVALENLMGNAWKFTGRLPQARIEVGVMAAVGAGEGETVFFVRDDGVGFEMAYADKLFGAFQRLHGANEFEGTGIGLATVQRIVRRHGGRVWAEGAVGRGATFSFTLAG